MLMQVKTSLITKIGPTCIVFARHKSHYDVLGLTPKATQSDIKSAYYKLSKIHHPDKSSVNIWHKLFYIYKGSPHQVYTTFPEHYLFCNSNIAYCDHFAHSYHASLNIVCLYNFQTAYFHFCNFIIFSIH